MAQDALPKPDLGRLFVESAVLMARLRGLDGCPWDRQQTPASIRKYTLEETYEVLDAIEQQDWQHLAEELGDLLLQVLFYAQMADEAGHFTLAEVVDGLNRKLIRRHPHVFGEEASAAAGNELGKVAPLQGPDDASGVLMNWQAIKQMEKRVGPQTPTGGRLSSVMRGQGALSEAAKLGSAAAEVGFDWPDVQGLIAKVHEEAAEIEAELQPNHLPNQNGRVAEEVGDLLFTVANLARHLKVDGEMTLRDANAKFRRRFEIMEQASALPLEALSADQLEQAWAAAKAREGSRS